MRPSVRFLPDELIETVLAQARSILCPLGVEINNDEVLAPLSDHGTHVDADTRRVGLVDALDEHGPAAAVEAGARNVERRLQAPWI
jgi:trimethylamine:corrinoid methyltransferase-like protein